MADAFDRQLQTIIDEISAFRTEKNAESRTTDPWGKTPRLLSLAITDLESAQNWLVRYSYERGAELGQH